MVVKIMFIAKEFYIDKRVVKRNIAHGQTTQKEYSESLNALPDLEEECERFTAESMLPEHLQSSKEREMKTAE